MSLTSLRRRSTIALLPLFAFTSTAYAAVDRAAATDNAVQAQQAPTAAPGATPPQVTGKTPWNFPIYDIPVDKSVRYGVLDNGMKYAIVHNETPKGTAAIRFRIGFGSIGETDSERGLAHYIEHLNFNGSKNVPEGEMVKLLERKGLAFGADTNASTGFDATEYKLDLPKATPDLLDTGLMLMRETASNLTLTQGAIDRERGVILSEMRTRDNFNLRRFEQYIKFEAPDTPFGNRLPIGTKQVLNNVTSAQVRSIYDRYYRPKNTVLVVVGDYDPDVVERAIKQHFSDWKPVGQPGAKLDRGSIDPSRSLAADIFVDPAVPTSISIDRLTPYVDRPTTVAELRRSILENLGANIVSRRIDRIAQQPDAPILGGGAGISSIMQAADQASVSITAKEGQWADALKIGEQQIRKATQYGFTQAELKEQLANMEQGFRQAAEQEDTRRNGALAEGIAETVSDDDIFVAPSALLAAFEKIKPTLATDAVQTEFNRHFTGQQPLIFVTSKTAIDGGKDKVLSVYREAAEAPIAAPKEEDVAQFGYTDFGTPGKIVADRTIPDLGIRTIRFANNVMLNLKQTDFEKGSMRYSIALGRGDLSFPKDEPGLGLYMSSMFSQGGLGKHSLDQLQSILAGEDVSVGLNAAMSNFGISGSTKMADFERQMEVSTAYVTDPGYRPEMQARWQALVPPFEAQLKSTPQQVAGAALGRILANGDTRFGIPDQATLLQRNAQELKSALAPSLADAPIEIAVVGDFDADQVIADVAKTFGALPQRKLDFGQIHDVPGVSFPSDTDTVTLYHQGTPDQGLAITTWPTTDDDDAQQEAVVAMLAQVMQLQLIDEIREKLGASYSPNAFSTMSDTFDNYGYLGVQVIVDPKDRQEVFDAVDQIAADLRNKPVDADTLQRALAPTLDRIDNSLKENGYWLGVASDAQRDADRLDRYRTRRARYSAVTAADIQAAARKFLQPDHELKIQVLQESLRGK